MTNYSPPLNGRNQTAIRELLRVTRQAPVLRVGGDQGGNPDRTTDGEDWFVLAVPAEMRDFLYAQLVELQEGNRKPRADCKYVAFAGWRFDLLERHLIAPGGVVMKLPGLEYAMLRAFIGRPRILLSRSELALASGRTGRPYLSARTVDCYVSRLRKRLGRGGSSLLISTVPKIGYSFDADVVWPRH
jgi:two-component system OmpR family response regulator